MFALMLTHRPTINIRNLTEPAARYDEYGMLLRTGRSPGEWFRMDGGAGGGDGGGDPGGDPSGGGGDPAGGGDPNADPNKGGDPGDPDPAKGKTGDDNIDALPEWAQKEIRKTRDEAAKARLAKTDVDTKLTAEQERMKQVMKALGLDKDEPTVEDLQKRLEQEQGEKTATSEKLKNLIIENTMTKVAVKHDADAEITLAVLDRSGKLAGLDPEADDFAEKLDGLVKAAVDGNPRLKVTQVAPKGGSKFKGNNSDGGPDVPQTLEDAVTAALNG